MEYCKILKENEMQKLRIVYETDDVPEGTADVELEAQIFELGQTQCVKSTLSGGCAKLSLIYICETLPDTWDEFSPKLYDAVLKVRFFKHDGAVEERELRRRIGICEMQTLGTQFMVNGRVSFLRALELSAERVAGFSEQDWGEYLTDIKVRGLNCVSLSGNMLSEELLDAADACGIYVKIHMGADKKVNEGAFDHPSLVLTSGENASDNGWMEFAVRDRRDYSDAPDTKSNHLEDIRKQDCPTIVTNVGEWRNPPAVTGAGLEYLAQICTREAMEEALRTPKFGGFCLHPDAAVLSLSQRRMREFSGAVVPLLMMKKYVWSGDETFAASMMIANYGQEKLFERVSVSAYDEHGQRYAVTSNKVRINSGGVMNVGQLRIPLEQFSPGQRLELTISIDNTPYRNHYAIWLFGDDISVKIPEHVHVTRKLDMRTRNLLADGKKVVYIPKLNTLKGTPGWFSPLASELSTNREVVASGGICCNPEHPALRGFPTEEMADFQWWNLMHNSIPVELPGRLRQGVIVSMPEEQGQEQKAIIFEGRVGHGLLLVCTIDLLIQLDRPEARQLYASLLSYAASHRFAPACEVRLEDLENLLLHVKF